MRVLVRDTSAGALSSVWASAAGLARADRVIAAASWDEVYRGLDSIPDPIESLQVWGHGSRGRPLIGGETVDLAALSDVVHINGWLWWRSCSVAEGATGHAFMWRCSAALNCDVVGHCAVISWPLPWRQAQIAGLRRGQDPWWSQSGDELPGCSTLRMSPPAWAWR